MKLLALDTSTHICGVCVLDTQTDCILAEESHDIGRGHAEVLMGLIETCFSKAELTYQDLSRIAVAIGPGSFTGVRVGMSVARGLGLSLGIPVLGISTLDASLAKARELGCSSDLVSLLDAKRGELYCKIADQTAFAATYAEIERAFSGSTPSLCGSGAEIFNDFHKKDLPIVHADAAPEIELIARLANQMIEPKAHPEPLYLRSADAKIQANFALERS